MHNPEIICLSLQLSLTLSRNEDTVSYLNFTTEDSETKKMKIVYKVSLLIIQQICQSKAGNQMCLFLHIHGIFILMR